MIGILPTLMPDHLSGHWMSESTRYQALNDSIFTARGEDRVVEGLVPRRLAHPVAREVVGHQRGQDADHDD
ncbi:hypothetical protein C6A85_03865, partial [Mycobacterium sp. ITM-2017-0098]